MTDIVERLRESADQWLNETESRYQAADEIERLRGLLREAREVIQTAYDEIGGYWYATEKLIPRIDAAIGNTNVTDANSAANRVASSALGQGVGVGAESHSALNPSEGVARAEVVATPGTPGGGASSIADKTARDCLERGTRETLDGGGDDPDLR